MSPTDEPADPADPMALRRQIAERFPIPPIAFSADGHRVALAGPVTLGLRIGGFAVVERADDRLVVHVRDLHVEERPGPELRFDEASAESGVGIAVGD